MARVMEKDTASRKKTLDTRDRILDAAEDVFYDKGYSNTTLNEIAEAASVTRGAIYWHFKNKEDLFEAMCSRVRQPMGEMIEEIVEKDATDPIAQLSKTHEFIMLEVIGNPHYRKVHQRNGPDCHSAESMADLFQENHSEDSGQCANEEPVACRSGYRTG